MARNNRSAGREESKPVLLIVPRERAQEQIAAQIAKGKELAARQIGNQEELASATNDRYSWDEYNTTLLKRIFSDDSVARSYQGIHVGGPDSRDFNASRQYFYEEIGSASRRLESIAAQLELYEEAADVARSMQGRAQPRTKGTSVFIVHGHDGGTKSAVARFIRTITGLEPVILHEQPDQGRTIIEKLEHYSRDVGFAIVLLTGDDLGATKPAVDAEGLGALKARARQNVLLELGYFLAQLGRAHVCALNVPGVEVPSDYQGVLFVPLDQSGGWKLTLARELAAAGYTIDSAKLLAS